MSTAFSTKNWAPSAVRIRQRLPASMPSIVAPARLTVGSRSSFSFWPLASVTTSSVSPRLASAKPSASRSAPGLANSADSAPGTATGLSWPPGSDDSSAVYAGFVSSIAKITPPGMPSSEIVSYWSLSVELNCSSALPWALMPYWRRKSKFVPNAATPHSCGTLPMAPNSSTNDAAPEARLPSLMTLIVPEAVNDRRVFSTPSTSRLPASKLALPRISMIGSSKTSARRSSIEPLMSMKKTLPIAPLTGGSTRSTTWKDCEPPSDRLRPASCHEPSMKSTVTRPAAKSPVR